MTKLTVFKNGPILVEGPCEMVDAEGNAIDTSDRKKIAICRCGASASKPFCDGSHRDAGFEG